MRALSIAVLVALAATMLAAGTTAKPALAQDYAPAVDFEDLMDSYFGDDDGYVSFGKYDLAFPPEGKARAIVGLVNAAGEVIAQYPIFEDYAIREGVFAKMAVQGPAGVQLTEPGIYTIVFVFDGKPITRFPFALKQAGNGADPFAPDKTYAFDGYWRTLAYFTYGSFKDEPIPVLSVWLGGPDMTDPTNHEEFFKASLHRDGELLAHSKRNTSAFNSGHFEREEVLLFHPHEVKQSPNATYFTVKELVDGDYELKVSREADDALLRHFKFTVAEGKIQQIPRARLGYEPAVDFILPRVTKKGSTGYEFVEAIWIGSE